MYTPLKRGERARHVIRRGDLGYEFHPRATEITILDQRGKSIWQLQRLEEAETLRWDGNDGQGNEMASGNYIFRIVYPDKEVVYVPFVLMK